LPTYLVSFPRSGNTAVRLFLERYTRKPTSSLYWDLKDHDCSILYPRSQKKPVVIKAHRFADINLQEEDKVIFILRDYKDSLVSYVRYVDRTSYLVKKLPNNKNYGAMESNILKKLRPYARNIIVFHAIPNDKLLVYYEDFVQEFPKEAERIIKFLGIRSHSTRILRSNVISQEAKDEVRDWFLGRIKKCERNINLGNNSFIGKYEEYLLERTVTKMEYVLKDCLKELFPIYLSRYT